MEEVTQILARAGLRVVSPVGSPDEVRTFWSHFLTARTSPLATIVETDDGSDLDLLNEAWTAISQQYEILSRSREFLISIAGPGNFDRPWLRVHAPGEIEVEELGRHAFAPSFVATDIDRSAAVFVSTQERRYEIRGASRPRT